MSEADTFADRAAIARLSTRLGLPRLERGWVWLAGAGPGDAGLVTALGLTAIAEADVILYDALVNETLLSLARPGAEIVYAGKRAGRKSCKQTDISRTLVAFARKRLRVLRLKGGDPLVFGRGAEEALTLARAKVPFRIVPGITAGIGGLAYAGIPLTHRDTNHSVTFITGHGADGRLPPLDWKAIAQSAPALVVYMGRKYAGEIATKLMSAGRSPDEPVALVANASFDQQSVSETTLGGLGLVAAQQTAPSIIVIGEIVRLRAGMDWLGAMTGRVLEPEPLGKRPLKDVS